MQYFQDYMQGNICYGCGTENKDGLHVKSYWEGDKAICIWHSQEKYQGWKDLLAGGVLASLIDCHCMGTAMADAYRREDRTLDSEPFYRYATGTMNIKYLKPTPNNIPIRLIAEIVEVKGKKTVLKCEAWSGETKTAESEVIAIRVFDSSDAESSNSMFGGGV